MAITILLAIFVVYILLKPNEQLSSNSQRAKSLPTDTTINNNIAVNKSLDNVSNKNISTNAPPPKKIKQDEQSNAEKKQEAIVTVSDKNNTNNSNLPANENEETSLDTNTNIDAVYKVRGKAFFHNEPDKSTRRNAFIVHWNNALLKPIEEKNDFVYVVYTNHLGQTSKGWLNKSELIKVSN